MALQATAAGFGLVAVGLLHGAGWLALADRYGAVMACLGLAVLDLLLAGVLLLLARRRVDPVALEALHMRKLALARLDGQSVVNEGLAALGWRVPAMAAAGLVVERLIRAIIRR